MRYEWDTTKNAANQRKHGLSFDAMDRFDWDFALHLETQTVDSETRDLTVAPLDANLAAVVTTERHGDTLRIISLRRATNTEIRKWRQEFHNG